MHLHMHINSKDRATDSEPTVTPPDLEGMEICHHVKTLDEEQKLKKLDWSLIPWLSLLYLLAFLTRTNIGNAKLAGIAPAIGLDSAGEQYNLALAVFFISYALFEPASNVLLKMLKPNHYLTLLMVLCGVITIATGFVKNAGGLYAARFCLGIVQAGVFPGVNYILSCWYRRSELGFRSAIFFSAAAISGSFGGLLAYGLQQMDGIANRGGWSWIFIIEGIVVVVIGVISWWMVFNFPEDYTNKPNSKRANLIRCVEESSHQKGAPPADTPPARPFSQTLKLSLTDWKTYTGIMIYGGAAGPLFAFSLFLPSLIADMGTYSPATAQLLTIPPYIVGCIATLLIALLADKTGQRGLCNIFTCLFAVLGFFLLLFGKNVAMKYTGTFLAAIGIYPCIPNAVAWSSNNILDPGKRGLSLGFVIGIGNLAGLVNCFVFRSKDKPDYKLGHGVVLGFLIVLLLGGSILQHILLVRENRRKREHLALVSQTEKNGTQEEIRRMEEEDRRRREDGNEDSDDNFVYVE
ncbi:hypothetical protein H072_10721 [Dactylellina haptotyla CBS 200.50]|uniref:Major facilitator superfamily (MFS) profile domain-containing protein n=1 Tax=Dactylellina haptotyla (strain CBS 200.50) TaxID=1284197 RepID=S8B9Q8_DACHA|nr:hypothetical protein H072_10721 [Dactylellina haptotyla CBS 200.50]